jgi:hypothetical protein
MAPDIEAAFNEFAEKLRTTPAETRAAASHRESLKSKLEESLGITAFFRTGSFGNGTNIPGFSDVDYFAVIPVEKLHQSSDYDLQQVANALAERFPTTGIRVTAPSVHVPFGTDAAESTEIVPVHHIGFTQLKFRQFDMPNGSSGWMPAAPESHKAYVDLADEKHSGKVKSLIRLLKAWKFRAKVPIRSFYLEIRAAHYAFTEGAIIYDIDIDNLLHAMLEDQLADYPDPRFPSDGLIIKACNSLADKIQSLELLRNACWDAERAQADKYAGNASSAIGNWNRVFK